MVNHSGRQYPHAESAGRRTDAALTVPFAHCIVTKGCQSEGGAGSFYREDHLLINHSHGALGKVEVRQALDSRLIKTRL